MKLEELDAKLEQVCAARAKLEAEREAMEQRAERRTGVPRYVWDSYVTYRMWHRAKWGHPARWKPPATARSTGRQRECRPRGIARRGARRARAPGDDSDLEPPHSQEAAR